MLLGFRDSVKIYGNIKAAFFLVKAPDDYALTLQVAFFAAWHGEVELNQNPCKRRYVFFNVAISAEAAYVFS
jgi:hypothetical protein